MSQSIYDRHTDLYRDCDVPDFKVQNYTPKELRRLADVEAVMLSKMPGIARVESTKMKSIMRGQDEARDVVLADRAYKRDREVIAKAIARHNQFFHEDIKIQTGLKAGTVSKALNDLTAMGLISVDPLNNRCGLFTNLHFKPRRVTCVPKAGA